MGQNIAIVKLFCGDCDHKFALFPVEAIIAMGIRIRRPWSVCRMLEFKFSAPIYRAVLRLSLTKTD